MNGITAIVADRERTEAPRPFRRPAPVKSQILFWLARRALCASELAERTGIDLGAVWVMLSQMRRDKQIYIVYRRVVEHGEDRLLPKSRAGRSPNAGRKRHVVNCYRARVR